MVAVQEVKYVLFDNVTVKWIWNEWELIKFREMWNEGAGNAELSKALKCNRKSIALLVIKGDQKFIKPRENGLFGHF